MSGTWKDGYYYKTGSGPFGYSVSVYKEVSRDEKDITLNMVVALVFKSEEECVDYINKQGMLNDSPTDSRNEESAE